MKRFRILISAHELSPYQGSECSVGWNIVTRLGQYHDVVVVYAKTNQLGTADYESHIKKYITIYGPVPGVRFIAIPQHYLTRILSRISQKISKDKSIGSPLIYYFCYGLWQKKVYRFSKKLMQKEKVDIVHNLTSVTFREPGYLWKLKIPFVWGPTGGFMPTFPPWSFLAKSGMKSVVLECLRYASNMLSVKASIRIRMAVNKASIIYLFNNRDRLFFARNKNGAVKTLLDTGTVLVPTGDEKCSDSDGLRILWCGRLVPSKAPDLFLCVLASLGHWNDMISVQIIGDGYLLPELISYAKRMSITNIEWISHVEHEEVLRYMHNSDILVHTSYREATSSVIPEALSVGLPVICHDAFGMAIAIDETCGIKIPLRTFDSSLAGFRDAILSLLKNRDTLVSLKRGALRRAQELSWDSKAMTIAKDYVEILKNENTAHK